MLYHIPNHHTLLSHTHHGTYRHTPSYTLSHTLSSHTISSHPDHCRLPSLILRYLGGGREGATDAAVALKAFAEHKSNGSLDPSLGPRAVDGGGGTSGVSGFQLAKDKAKQLQQEELEREMALMREEQRQRTGVLVRSPGNSPS